MNKLFAFLSVFFLLNTYAQNTITITMQPASYKRVVLYTAEGAQQKYVAHSDSENGEFNLTMPADSPTASYRLVYNQQTMDYFDFLYFGKSLHISIDPSAKEVIPQIDHSPENNWYFERLFLLNNLQRKMDDIQVSFFKPEVRTDAVSLIQEYQNLQKQVDEWHDVVKNANQPQFVKDILMANQRVLPDQPSTNPQEYLTFIKNHFFDPINFNNPNLIQSSVLVDKVMDFVFYLTVADDTQTQNEMYKNAVSIVMSKIQNVNVLKGFMQSLVQSFAQTENVFVIDYLLKEYHDKLPVELQNDYWKNHILNETATAITRKAPDFKFMLNNKETSLYQLSGYEKYIIVFWSTSCSHCMKELPMFYDFIKDDPTLKVIAVGMESEADVTKWKSETYYYPNFIHVLAQGKWESPLAKSYNIHATPNYFILDQNKIITDKPYDFEALEKLLNIEK